jgi:lactoylglutathione lyase
MSGFTETVVTRTEEQRKHNFSWQQTMLRIKDPKITVPFYENNFGFRLLHKYDFPQWSFSLYFLYIPSDGGEIATYSIQFLKCLQIEKLPEPGTAASEEFLWTMTGTCLELTHNYGTENDESFKVIFL